MFWQEAVLFFGGGALAALGCWLGYQMGVTDERQRAARRRAARRVRGFLGCRR